MYVGWQGSHTPSEAVKEYFEIYAKEKDATDDTLEKRYIFQAQTTQTDYLFGNIINNLKKNNI